MKLIHLLFFWVLAANLADMVTTLVGLKLPNVYEANLFAASMLKYHFAFYLVSKIAVPSAGAFLFVLAHNFCKRWYNKFIIEVGTGVLAMVFTISTINNILVIIKFI